MPSCLAQAAARVAWREAIASMLLRRPCCMAGIVRSTAILETPSTPHDTLRIASPRDIRPRAGRAASHCFLLLSGTAGKLARRGGDGQSWGPCASAQAIVDERAVIG